MFKAAKFVALAIILPLVLASVSNLYGAEARTLTLFGEGVSPCPIVLPEQPSAVQKTAAEELASFLNQVTGAEFPIIGESAADQQGVNLVIGPSALSKKLLTVTGSALPMQDDSAFSRTVSSPEAARSLSAACSSSSPR